MRMVLIHVGLHRVAARVTAKVERPRADKPTEGVLIFNTEISPMASPVFESGRYIVWIIMGQGIMYTKINHMT